MARSAPATRETPRQAQQSARGMTGSPIGGTGERNEVYGVVSVLYHALQGADTYEQYIADAREAGDSELEQFFQSCQQEERQRAQRAKELLVERLDEMAEDDDSESDDDDES